MLGRWNSSALARLVHPHIPLDEAPDLAHEFEIASVPTMVFLRPDRSVLGTITGYRDVGAFLAEANKRIAELKTQPPAKS